MPDFYFLFSHTLTSKQIKEAKTILKVNKIIYLPAHLQKVWSNVPANGDISEILNRFIKYLRKIRKLAILEQHLR